MTWESLPGFMKGWGSLLVAARALFLGLFNTWIARHERRWKLRDRKDEHAKRQWCRAVLRELRQGIDMNNPERRLLILGYENEVPDERREWALWGEERRYFTVRYGSQGAMFVALPRETP